MMSRSVRSNSTLYGRFCGLIVLLAAATAQADHGSCKLSPAPAAPGTQLAYEPAQRAIILWNGKEEILLLSTDVSYYATGTLTEGIPLPALPTAAVSSPVLFVEWAALLSRKGMPSTNWLPSAPRGTVLAPLSIARSDDPRFTATLAYCGDLFADYRGRGYEWMVLDTIGVQDSLRSYDPIEYRFESNKVFYPLAISTRDYGHTQVDLFIITYDSLSWFGPLDHPLSSLGSVALTTSELAAVSPEWARFMSSVAAPGIPGRPGLVAQHLRISGDIRTMNHDLLAR